MDPKSNQDQGLSSSQPQSGTGAVTPPATAGLFDQAPPLIRNAPVEPSSQSINQSTLVSNTLTPAEAADTDVIEKEWVTRAKQIVADTQADPFRQAMEINRLKADYMKKRYNKDIKSPDA